MPDFPAFSLLGQQRDQLDRWPVASPTSSGKVAKTPYFTSEHLGSAKIQGFFHYGGTKRRKHTPFLVYSLHLGPASSASGFGGDSIFCSWIQNMGGALHLSVGSATFPHQPWFLLYLP